MKTPASTKATGKPKSKRPTAWKPGQSGNPKGRQKNEHSWKEVIAELSHANSEDITALIGETTELGRMVKGLPKSVQMKYLVTARVFAALMFEPTAGLWNGLMDRMEGKVPQRVQMDGELEVEGLAEMLRQVYGESKDQSG